MVRGGMRATVTMISGGPGFVKFATQVVQVEEPSGSTSTTATELAARYQFARGDHAPDLPRRGLEVDGEGGGVDQDHAAFRLIALAMACHAAAPHR
jgi:hypothetical protein